MTFLEALAPRSIRVHAWDSAPAEDTPLRALHLVRPRGEGAVVSLSGRARDGELLLFLGESIATCVGGALVTGDDSLEDATRHLRERPAPSLDGIGAWFLAFAGRWTEDADEDDEEEVEVPWARGWLSRTRGTVPESLLAPQQPSAAADLGRQCYLTLDEDAVGLAVSAEEAALVRSVQETLFETAGSSDDSVETSDFLAALQAAGASASLLSRAQTLLGDDDAWTELTIVER